MLNGQHFGMAMAVTVLGMALVLVPSALETKSPSTVIVIASGPMMLAGSVMFGLGGQFQDASICYGIGAAMCLASSCILAAAGMSLAYKQMKR